jgi:hypothetical protein
LNNPSAHCRHDRTHPDAARALPGWQASTLDVPGQRYASVAASGRVHRWGQSSSFPCSLYSPLHYLSSFQCSFFSHHLVAVSYCPLHLPQLTVAVHFRSPTTVLVHHNSILLGSCWSRPPAIILSCNTSNIVPASAVQNLQRVKSAVESLLMITVHVR